MDHPETSNVEQRIRRHRLVCRFTH